MIYYSHINEDNLAERTVMNAKYYDSLVAIAGSGERIIALMDHPTLQNIDIIDNNKDALFLTELKIQAIAFFVPEIYLKFVGFLEIKSSRYELFNQLKNTLSEDCQNYWTGRQKEIENGILNCGHFEIFLNKIRPFLKLILGPNFYQLFHQNIADIKQFPTLRWKFAIFLFSIKPIYKLFGMRDSAFISEEASPQYIPVALHKSIIENRVNESCLFHLIFYGHLNNMPSQLLPHSFRIKTLSIIKSNLNKKNITITYHLADALKTILSIKFNTQSCYFFSLSDLLSYVDMDYMKKLFTHIQSLNIQHCTLVTRTFIRNRISFSQFKPYIKNYKEVKDISAFDRTNQYQVICIDY